MGGEAISKQQRINDMIRAREVRVIGPEGGQLGILSIREALQMAEEHGFDLVEVAPDAKPPVCRIMDFGKYKYQQSKRLQQAKKKQKVISVKEIKLRPKTEEHDYQFKTQHVRRFLEEGHKTKVTVVFRGREIAHAELGRRMLDRIVADMQDIGTLEQVPQQEGRNMTMVLSPRAS
jgi:translation initiation factor IF-3